MQLFELACYVAYYGASRRKVNWSSSSASFLCHRRSSSVVLPSPKVLGVRTRPTEAAFFCTIILLNIVLGVHSNFEGAKINDELIFAALGWEPKSEDQGLQYRECSSLCWDTWM